ncbi:MAG: glycosyltransferase family 2 protein [Clostridiales bacterium]|jgi:cellulose synthase/poly-beta-1,6-N-acetylglucosamine synthase-like glycosyltransferase|nr:glycosyltransferase family 2 protein [Clostridiales bacterium]
METIGLINYILSITFTIFYLYQFVYILAPIFKKNKHEPTAAVMHRYGVLISARNEEAVIGQLIENIHEQNYPNDLITVFVVADNCTDNTAKVARDAGAVVYERFNKQQIGKGYALDFLLTRIYEDYPRDAFDGFFVFDADNLLDENFISEMNKTFSQGYKIITSYRNSKNYDASWISAGYSLWFLRESQFLNYSRMLLGTSCSISGTGFLMHRNVIEKNGGWKFFLLTEDIEFSVHTIINGERIAFCRKAILYDEQPTDFRQSWRQRLRWAKGFLQVFHKYGGALAKSAFTNKSFSSFDMLMIILPAILLTLLSAVCNITAIIIGTILDYDVYPALNSLVRTCVNGYLLLFTVGLITLISEWKQIHCRSFYKIIYLFTFPVFEFTYIPIAFAALVGKVEWKPIIHKEVKTLADVRGEIRKAG